LRIEEALETSQLVAQGKPPLLQAPQQQFVTRHDLSEPVDGGVEVGMLDPQFDQLSRK
jgi:hypothetical protein